MFYWILSTIFISFGTIFRKKSLAYKCSNILFTLFWYSFDFVLISLFFLLWKYDLWIVNSKLLFLFILIFFLYLLSVQIKQYIYKNEKISVITPYENLNKIISIILAFFIFADISNLSFIITLIAWVIIILSSIDFKKFELSKFIKAMFVWQLCISIRLLLIWYILNYITPLSCYVLISTINIWLLFIMIFFTWEYKNFFHMAKFFHINRSLWSALLWISNIINIFIIASLWVTMSILFSYMYIWIILLLSYFFFQDKPSRKNIILTVILSILVWFWYYFK